MKGLNHILLAFDGSKHGVEALKSAEQMAKLSGAHVTVAYVHNPSTEINMEPGVIQSGNPRLHYTSTYVGIPAAGEGVERKQNDVHVQDNTPETVLSDAKLRLSNVINADYEILSGKPADELVDFAKEKDVDLIIMGNRGINGIKKLVMGSVSKKVLDNADCPVLVVK